MKLTILHIMNYSIPIVCMAAIGFWLDHLCKPSKDSGKQTLE
ncbi:hypothetical protein [Bacillus testis]|nr:hypothetical protein [Bacillus testis]